MDQQRDSDETEQRWWSETEICREFCRPHSKPRAAIERTGARADEGAEMPVDGSDPKTPGLKEKAVFKRRGPLEAIRSILRRRRGSGILG